MLAHLFEHVEGSPPGPFSRLRRSQGRARTGAGLGLVGRSATKHRPCLCRRPLRPQQVRYRVGTGLRRRARALGRHLGLRCPWGRPHRARCAIVHLRKSPTPCGCSARRRPGKPCTAAGCLRLVGRAATPRRGPGWRSLVPSGARRRCGLPAGRRTC